MKKEKILATIATCSIGVIFFSVLVIGHFNSAVMEPSYSSNYFLWTVGYFTQSEVLGFTLLPFIIQIISFTGESYSTFDIIFASLTISVALLMMIYTRGIGNGKRFVYVWITSSQPIAISFALNPMSIGPL